MQRFEGRRLILNNSALLMIRDAVLMHSRPDSSGINVLCFGSA